MVFDGGWSYEVLYGSPLLQLLASLVALAALLAAGVLVRKVRGAASDKVTANFAEAVEMVALAVVVVIVTYVLGTIWGVTYVFDLIVDGILVDRWTGIRTTTTVALVVVGYLLVRGVNRSLDRLRSEGAFTTHQTEIAYHVADIAIFALVGLGILSVWGVNLTNVILGASVVTAVLGLAAQKTVAAIIAGFMLLFAQPFKAGDWIEFVGQKRASGIVQDITMSHTKIRTFNDEHVLVPNDELTDNQLINYSRSDRLRIDVEIDVDYDTDPTYAREVVREAVEPLEVVSPVESPKVVLKRLGDSAVVLELQFWIENPERRRVLYAQTEAITAVKEALDREEITIPFPQRTHSSRAESSFRVESPTQAGRDAPNNRLTTESEDD